MINTSRIIVASTPRTGSMWTFNIIREIINELNYIVIPKLVPQNDSEMCKLHLKHLNEKDKNTICIIKIHSLLKKIYYEKSKVIFNLRDPRDALVSFLRFMKFSYNLNEKIEYISDSIKKTEYIRNNIKKDDYLEIFYNNIIFRPEDTVNQICNFLNLEIQFEQINKIVEKYSKKNVIKSIKKKEEMVTNKIKKNEKLDKKEIVFINKSNYRIFDEDTGFQSGHVSSYKEGEWKNILTNIEQNEIKKEFGHWFKENNFNV